MFLTDRKLERRIDELKEYRYRDIKHLESFFVKEDTEKQVNPQVPNDFSGWDVLKTGDLWSGRDKYLWLKKEITLPAEWSGKKILGIFDFGNTGAGNNSGFESLFYVNSIPFQGVDANHKEVFFKEEMYGQTIQAVFRLWSGLEGGGIPKDQEHRINRADLAWLDEQADDLYYMGQMVWDTIKNLSADDPITHELRAALDCAFHCIDWSYPGSEEFYHSVHEADQLLNDKIEQMEKHSKVNIRCVGHTHIDVAWLWRLKNTREKCSRSFSTVLRLMEKYPEYIFLQTQPQLYEYIKEDFPDIYEQIKKKVQDGQWEVDGGMWVEADCNLTSGESLTRQLLIGSQFIQNEFGKKVEYLWLPDVFGYSWALPQILKKSGINTFMTTKISWNQYNRMPHDTFMWKGIDGSEVLTHFITTPTPWDEPGSWFYTYNGELIPKTVKGTWDAYTDKNITKDLLIAYGHGDGGGGVNRDMLERRRRIDKIPGLPNLKTATAGEYFRDLNETVNQTDQYVHTWDGELYLEYHRGTYTSHAHNKRMNRKMEFLYREAEWMMVMDAVQKGDLSTADQETLTKGWKILLTNQFHDIIPGSSIQEVYEDSKIDYETAQTIAENAKLSFLENKKINSGNMYTIINNTSWTQSGIVCIPEYKKKEWIDEKGRSLSSQIGEAGTYIQLIEVPAMGFVVIHSEDIKEAEQTEKTAFTVNDHSIETPFYSITLNKNGQIIRLYDKEYDREVLKEGQCANVLQMFEDKPIDNDAWDIDIFYQEKMREINDLCIFEITECGPCTLRIRMKWNYMNSVIEQDMVLYAEDRRIDFETKVDYHEQHQLLKAAFPVDIRSTYATYDIQYGNVRRPNHWNTSWDQARFESVAHKWVDLSDHDYGVSLLNDCKYGYDVKDNVLRITLIKAATHPDHSQDQGEHIFTYALLPHSGDFVKGETEEKAYALNQPLTAVEGKIELPYESFLTIKGGKAAVDAVKRSEDGKSIVIRFHEYTGSVQKLEISLGIPYTAWAESDLMEHPIEEFHKDEAIIVKARPYEIKTILVQI